MWVTNTVQPFYCKRAVIYEHLCAFESKLVRWYMGSWPLNRKSDIMHVCVFSVQASVNVLVECVMETEFDILLFWKLLTQEQNASNFNFWRGNTPGSLTA